MAIGTTKGNGVRSGGVPLVCVGSAHGSWYQVNDDARTAQTATMLYNPNVITDSTFHWVSIPQGTTGVLPRARVPIATTAVGTSPIIYLLGASSTSISNVSPEGVNDGTIRIMRLDTVAIDGTGLTLTFPASPVTTNCLNDATWFYSATPSLAGYDCRGSQWVGVAVQTAGACTASAAMPVDLLFLGN